MPFINLNSTILDNLPDELAAVQRPMYYGDALFETMRVIDGHIPLFERHWQRLAAGMTKLGFDLPMGWGSGFFQKEILRTPSLPNARVRLTIWRSPGGNYKPENNTPQFLITLDPLKNNEYQWAEEGIEIGVSQSVRLPIDLFSNLKSLNTTRYVVASREAQASGWSEALLLNCHERVCEATSSNVFWWKNETLYTVPLSEGCVAGVFRAVLLETVDKVQEKISTVANLHDADEIFLTNAVRGIIPVRIFAGRMKSSLLTKRLYHSFQDVLFPQNKN